MSDKVFRDPLYKWSTSVIALRSCMTGASACKIFTKELHDATARPLSFARKQ